MARFSDDGPLCHVIPHKEGRLVFVFDVTRPIESQVTEAKRQAIAYQTRHEGKTLQTRGHEGKLAGYLRAYDSRKAGICVAEAADWFYNEGVKASDHAKWVRDACAAAERYIDGEYRALIG